MQFLNLFRSSVYFHYAKLGTFLIIPFLLYIFPISIFDNSIGSICLIKRLTGNECWGCGTRHAIYDIMNLEFLNAYNHNKMSFLIFGILFYLWFKYIYKEIKAIRKLKREEGKVLNKS